jgi:diguanylate cyclase (GGDEF)-like protein
MLSEWIQRLRAQDWPAQLGGVLAAAAAVAGVALAVQRMADHHLAAEADRAAHAWGRHLASAVPDIDLIFMGEVASPPAQDRLTAIRDMAGMARFTLFDPQGRAVLVSESVGTAPGAETDDPARRQRAREVARHGASAAELSHGDGGSLPSVTSSTWLPVRHGTVTIGVAEIVLDHSEAAVTTANSFRRAALLAGLAMAVCIIAAAAFLRRRAGQERKALSRVAFMAEHDLLTGALNHSHFSLHLDRVCNATRPGQGGGLALICIDLDGFAEVNDRHGHQVGDELLRRTCTRLQGVLRAGDLLARLAGDRFAVLQRGAADSPSVTALVQRMVDCLAEPHDLPDLPEALRVSACVGAALHGVDGSDADTLLHNAELALLRAKSSGRGEWSFYDAALDRRLQERRTLSNELRQALAEGRLRLHFQPLYSAGSTALSGYEALARWPHPRRGFVPPAEFIPVAEDSGQIEALGRWVLQAACTEAALWPQPLSVAVNLSAAQFRRGDAIVDEVAQALRASGLAPARLELEITESLLMHHTEQVVATLHALKALGVRIAMDDFGTGYSSLAYLWRFPFDKLKIDRAFTQGLGVDPRVDLIVRSIVRMAHSLSIRVNAEGVETEAQCEALRRCGCDELQGYLLGRPVPASRLAHLESQTAAMVLMD